MEIIKTIGLVGKYIIKRITCKHEYEWRGRWYGNHGENRTEIIDCEIYRCTKCGKELMVKLDRDVQIKK